MRETLQGGELVEVGGEEGGAADGGHEVLADGPGQAEAVVGAGAAPQLVDYHQRARAGSLRGAGVTPLSLGLAHTRPASSSKRPGAP